MNELPRYSENSDASVYREIGVNRALWQSFVDPIREESIIHRLSNLREAASNGSEQVQGLTEIQMASTRQRNAARQNIKKAAAAARRKRTIAHLPKSVRTALGKQGASVAKKKRRSSH
jgi:hypothetical protein